MRNTFTFSWNVPKKQARESTLVCSGTAVLGSRLDEIVASCEASAEGEEAPVDSSLLREVGLHIGIVVFGVEAEGEVLAEDSEISELHDGVTVSAEGHHDEAVVLAVVIDTEVLWVDLLPALQ